MLTAVYQKILRTINEMPEDYTYRKTTQVQLISKSNNPSQTVEERYTKYPVSSEIFWGTTN